MKAHEDGGCPFIGAYKKRIIHSFEVGQAFLSITLRPYIPLCIFISLICLIRQISELESGSYYTTILSSINSWKSSF